MNQEELISTGKTLAGLLVSEYGYDNASLESVRIFENGQVTFHFYTVDDLQDSLDYAHRIDTGWIDLPIDPGESIYTEFGKRFMTREKRERTIMIQRLNSIAGMKDEIKTLEIANIVDDITKKVSDLRALEDHSNGTK